MTPRDPSQDDACFRTARDTARQIAARELDPHSVQRYDLLLSPTMPIPAAYAEARGDAQPSAGNSWSWVVYTYAFNLTKNPSASIPCGFADGLPIGLMVTGPLYDDLAVLQACRAYEAAAGTAWPSPALNTALAKIEGSAGGAVKAKIQPVR